MHGIVKPIDIVLSTQSAEWHGLADVVPFIGAEEAAPLLFPIRTGNISVDLGDGGVVAMGNHKALVADLRACRSDLFGTENELVPLHIPKNSYRPIENGEVWAAMQTALAGCDIDATVSTVGTLEAAKKFFISVTLKGDEGFKVNNDEYLANLNFITSHDGTLAVKAYDSTVRIVCMNTLRASLEAAGEVDFTIYHTAGAETAMANFGPLVAEILAGRETFKTNLEYLASVACTGSEAREIALGYFVASTGAMELAKRSMNAADEIATLFSRGKGNDGKSLYDLLNGATEYWTNGDGTGKKASAREKVYKANFGGAADHKNAFANFLLNPEGVAKLREAGQQAESLAIQAGTV